jgi:O-antigen ligase
MAYTAAVVLLSYRDNLTLAAKAIGALLGLAFFFLVFAKGKRIVVPITYRIWGAWFGLALVSCALAEHIEIAAYRALTVAQVASVGFLVTNLLIWNRSTRFYTTALIGVALASTVMVMTNPGLFASIDGRVHGPLGNANTFGVLLSVSMVLSLVAALGTRNLFAKALFLGAAAVIFTMLLQTGSRKAMLIGVLMGGTLVCIAYLYKSGAAKIQSFMRALIIVAALLPVGITFLINSDFWYRTERAMDVLGGDSSNADSSLIGRAWLAKRAIDVAAANPVFGIGLDTFRMARGIEIGVAVGTYSHSNYLEILVSTGVLGFGLYFYIYWLWFKKLYALRRYLKSPTHFSRYAMVAIVTTMIALMDIGMVSYYDKVMWLVLPWLVAELHLFDMEEKEKAVSRKAQMIEDRRISEESPDDDLHHTTPSPQKG